MSTVRISFDEAKASLENLAAARPDYVYKEPEGQVVGDCMYFDPATGAPSCIVGHVLAEYGGTYNDVDGWNTGTVLALPGRVLDTDDKTVSFLRAAQKAQDSGDTWGTAVADALDAANDTEHDDDEEF